MKILIACEESQSVCIEMRKAGHEAYSCDILPCTGGKPEWHIQEDVLTVIEREKWDAMIAFPPCTHLAVSGAAWFEQKKKDGRQQQGIDFFMKMVNAPINFIAIENPIGIMSSIYRKPDQIINPYYFGDSERKPTCLWLKNLPKLIWHKENNLFGVKTMVEPKLVTMTSQKTGRTRTYSEWEYITSCNQEERAAIRSKTFPGIAKAMGEQWGNYLHENSKINIRKFG